MSCGGRLPSARPYCGCWQHSRGWAYPRRWDLAAVFSVCKGNGKPGVDGFRLFAQLCGLGRSFLKAVLDWRGPARGPGWAFGGYPGLRREEAMAIQQMVSWRFFMGNWIVLTRFHDAANAFWSVARGPSLEANRGAVWPSQAQVVEQRLTGAVVRLQDETGCFDILVNEGVLPGDHAGPRMFNKTYEMAVDRAVGEYLDIADNADELMATAPGQETHRIWGSLVCG